MFCSNCGGELPSKAKFCPGCGHGLPNLSRTTRQTTSQSPIPDSELEHLKNELREMMDCVKEPLQTTLDELEGDSLDSDSLVIGDLMDIFLHFAALAGSVSVQAAGLYESIFPFLQKDDSHYGAMTIAAVITGTLEKNKDRYSRPIESFPTIVFLQPFDAAFKTDLASKVGTTFLRFAVFCACATGQTENVEELERLRPILQVQSR